jgi:hypothetical protein
MGDELREGRELRRRGSEGAADDVQPAGNARQLAEQPTERRGPNPLIPQEWGTVASALVTAAASVLIYAIGQIDNIDKRLDSLEQEARILLDGQGGIRPSKEVLQNFFHIEAILRRLDRLEGHK